MNKRRHPRFVKRLTARFFADQKRLTGILSDLSESGLFIRTKRGFPVDTPIDVELLLPNNKVSFLKGIVKRTIKPPVSSLKHGMSIEITERDEEFDEFLESVTRKHEANCVGQRDNSGLRIMSFSSRASEEKDSRHTCPDRRLDKRFNVRLLKVTSELPSASAVRIEDISVSGMLARADQRLDIGGKYTLTIGYGDLVRCVEADVMWSLLVDSRESDGDVKPIYLAGMRFTEVSRKAIREIIDLIDSDTEAMKHLRHKPEKKAVKEGRADSKERPEEEREDIPGTSERASSGEFMKNIEEAYDRHERHALTYYKILDVVHTAGAEEIKKAYHRQAKALHPDRHLFLSPEMKEKLNYLFSYLTEAYETLTNPRGKEKYDTYLLAGERGTASGRELAQQEFEHGKWEFWNGHFFEAERFLKKAVSLDDHSDKYFYFYAKTLLRLGKSREAEKAIKKALKIDALRPDYLTEAGYIYHALGLSERAREFFDAALRFQPSHTKAREGIEGLDHRKGRGSVWHNLYNSIRGLKKPG